MPRFAGYKNNQICIISDYFIEDSDFDIVQIGSEFSEISSTEIMTNYFIRGGKITSKNHKISATQLKVAFVGNWKMACGISTYSENLWPEVIKQIGDYRLFIEKNDINTGTLNTTTDLILDSDKINSCWKRGESLIQLVDEIKKYDPDIVWFQHEFGIWPNARYWLSMMSQLSNYRVIVTMHSVFHHKDKTICEAAMPEIVVHIDGARDVLKFEKQIPGIVYVIPHGCTPCADTSKLWNFYKSERTFLQFGFGFRYKGWEMSIRAAGLLKKKYEDVFFTGLFSESNFNHIEHQTYFNELMGLINELGLQENVALIKGFQSDATLDAYMRVNKATLFPYVSSPEHEVFGASGAARLAMSRAVPVITSSVNHFLELPTIKADTAEGIAEELSLLFDNPSLAKKQTDKQIKYINENTWKKIAAQYVSIFEGG